MIYTIILRGSALKQFNKLPKTERLRIQAAMELLKTNPIPPTAKKLINRPGHSVRVGNYRIIYKVNRSVIEILILKISHRKDVYRD